MSAFINEYYVSGKKVPVAEYQVLQILINLGESYAPGILRESKAKNGPLTSVASVYTLLGRLEKRGLVTRREVTFDLGDMPVRRVLYSPSGMLDTPLSLDLKVSYESKEKPPVRTPILSGEEDSSFVREVAYV